SSAETPGSPGAYAARRAERRGRARVLVSAGNATWLPPRERRQVPVPEVVSPPGGGVVPPLGGSVVPPLGGSVVPPLGGSVVPPLGGSVVPPLGGGVVPRLGGGVGCRAGGAVGGGRLAVFAVLAVVHEMLE